MLRELPRIRYKLSRISNNSKMMEYLSIKMLMMFLIMTRKKTMRTINTIARTMRKLKKLISCRKVKRDVELIKDKTAMVMIIQTMTMSLEKRTIIRPSLMTQLAMIKMIMALRMMLRRWNSVDKINYRLAQTRTMTWMMLMTLMKTMMLS